MPGFNPWEVAMDGSVRELGRRWRVGAVEAEEMVEVIMVEAIEKACFLRPRETAAMAWPTSWLQ